MAFPHTGPPMDPANPILHVYLMITYDDKGDLHVADKSNIPLEFDWDRVINKFASEGQQARVLPPGEYVFTVHHNLGFRVVELPTEGLSEQTRLDLIELIQPFCEETFRSLCVALVCFPTPREIRQAAKGIVDASVHAMLKILQDPQKLEPNFLTLVPAASVRARRVEQDGIITMLFVNGGVMLPGGMSTNPGIPDEAGRLEVKVGYLPKSPINDWLNEALVARLNEAIAEVRDEVLLGVIEEFEGKRTWYEKAVTQLRRFVGL